MFIGHFALGFAAKRVAPSLNLGTAFLAAQLLDLVWPIFVLLGVERVSVDPGATAVTPLNFESYPWSHSLVTTLGWSVGLALLVTWRSRDRRLALLTAALVASHWLLDWLTHRPDLQLVPGVAVRTGLGLWDSLPATLALEGAVFAAAVVSYARASRALRPRGTWALWGLVAFLTLIYAGNVFGPPPPVGAPGAALAGPALAMWLLVLWGYWVDRNREAVAS